MNKKPMATFTEDLPKPRKARKPMATLRPSKLRLVLEAVVVIVLCLVLMVVW